MEEIPNPTPLMILGMSYSEQMLLLKSRVIRESMSMWTYIEFSKWPPVGCEFHYTPSEHFSQINYSIDVNRLPSFSKESTGYEMFCKQHRDTSNKVLLDEKSWKQSADLCIRALDAMIREWHGIVYQLKKEHEEMVSGSVVKLNRTTFHICDYLSILANDDMGGNIDEIVVIEGKFKPSDVSHPLIKVPKSVINFVMVNLDYLFMFYGLWGNNSELPITLLPPKSNMPCANKIMKMKEYPLMQRGKQQCLRFRFFKVDSIDLSFRNIGLCETNML